MIDEYQYALKWAHRAEREEDPFDKFVYCFFALNALYSKYYETSERKAIEKLFDSYYKDAKFKKAIGDILRMTEFQYFIVRRPIKNCRFRNNSSQERYVDTSIDHAKIKEKSLYRSNKAMLMILYQIRCNLFHGNKAFYNEDDQKIMSNASSLLLQYVKAMLDGNYIGEVI